MDGSGYGIIVAKRYSESPKSESIAKIGKWLLEVSVQMTKSPNFILD